MVIAFFDFSFFSLFLDVEVEFYGFGGSFGVFCVLGLSEFFVNILVICRVVFGFGDVIKFKF